MNKDNYWVKRRKGAVSRRGMLAGAAGLGALVAAGCGDDDDDESQATSKAGGQTATAPASATAAAATPRKGGVWRVATTQDPPHLDPHATTSLAVHKPGPGMAMSRLLYTVPADDPIRTPPKLSGDLAEKWEQPDPQTVIVTLRNNARWHDVAPVSGRAVVANDIVYSFKRQLTQPATASFLGPIEAITAPSERTVQIKLKLPDNEAVLQLAESRNKILAPEITDPKAGPMVGSGPLMFDGAQKGTGWKFKPNPNSHLAPLPYTDAVDVAIIPDPTSQVNALRQGQIHMLGDSAGVAKRDADSFEKNDKFKVRNYRIWSGNYIILNTARPEFKDVRVRQAIWKLIDRPTLGNVAFQGAVWFQTSVRLPDESYMLPRAELDRLLAANKQEARQLLQAAGVTTLDIEMLSLTGNFAGTAAAEFLTPVFGDSGIKLKLREVGPVEYSTQVVAQRTFQAYIGFATTGSSTNSDLQRWTTGGSLNSAGFSDPAFDEVIRKQAVERDDKLRRGLLEDIQRRVVAAASFIPLASNTVYEVKDARLNAPGSISTQDSYEYFQYCSGWFSA